MTPVDEAVGRVKAYVEALSVQDAGYTVNATIGSAGWAPLTLGDLRALLSALELGRLDAEAGGWRPIDDPSLPKGGTPIHVQRTITYRFLPYRKGAPQLQKGIPGRWQVATEYGFENSEPPPQGSRWRPLPAPPTGEGGDVPDPPACAGKDDWS